MKLYPKRKNINIDESNLKTIYQSTTQIDSDQIAACAITTDKITVNAVTEEQMAALSINIGQIVNGAITNVKLADAAVETAKVAAEAITNTLIANDAIETQHVLANAITTAKIAAGAILAGQIAANAIEAGKIAANAVTAGCINVDSLSAISANIGTVNAGNISGAVISQADNDIVINSIGISIKNNALYFIYGLSTQSYFSVTNLGTEWRGGNLYLNGMPTGEIIFTVAGDLGYSIRPSVTNTIPLGAINYQWSDVWAVNVHMDSCQLTYNASTLVNSGVLTPMNFNIEKWDTNNMHSTSTNNGTVYIKTAGKYSFFAEMRFEQNADGIRYCGVSKNGDLIGILEIPALSDRATTLTSELGRADCAVNDAITVNVYQSSGVALNVTSTGNWSPIFGVTRIA